MGAWAAGHHCGHVLAGEEGGASCTGLRTARMHLPATDAGVGAVTHATSGIAVVLEEAAEKVLVRGQSHCRERRPTHLALTTLCKLSV